MKLQRWGAGVQLQPRQVGEDGEGVLGQEGGLEPCGQVLGSGQRLARWDSGRTWHWGPAWPSSLPGPHQDGTLVPKCFRSCSRNMNVSTVWGMRRIPAGKRPWMGKGGEGSGKSWEGPWLRRPTPPPGPAA